MSKMISELKSIAPGNSLNEVTKRIKEIIHKSLLVERFI
jgi:hypothetical protein